MKRTLTYWWNDSEKKSISESHQSELDKHALEHAMELIAKGYREGQLTSTIEEKVFFGWWEFSNCTN